MQIYSPYLLNPSSKKLHRALLSLPLYIFDTRKNVAGPRFYQAGVIDSFTSVNTGAAHGRTGSAPFLRAAPQSNGRPATLVTVLDGPTTGSVRKLEIKLTADDGSCGQSPIALLGQPVEALPDYLLSSLGYSHSPTLRDVFRRQFRRF